MTADRKATAQGDDILNHQDKPEPANAEGAPEVTKGEASVIPQRRT